MNTGFDFAKVPLWYVLCTQDDCPLRDGCLRFLAAQQAPEDLESAKCVMPGIRKGDNCRWFNSSQQVTYAAGFEHLFDRVLAKDFTTMRKTITKYLHGVKFYYEYKRGDRMLSPAQQAWIRNYVRTCGYDWEVPFDNYVEDYCYEEGPQPPSI